MNQDSRVDTYKHIQEVQYYLSKVIKDLVSRSLDHDQSKLSSPEVELFDEFTPLLKNTEYGSQEYKDFLGRLKPALDHHYKMCSHHPEHFTNGIRGMNLLDIMEMLCDWKASSKRCFNGDIRKSIEINKERFNISDDLVQVLLNTLSLLENDD